LGHAARTLILDSENYREIARDAYMNAPAVLIVLLTAILRTFNRPDGFSWLGVVVQLAAWVLAMVVLQLTARMLRAKRSQPDPARGRIRSNSVFFRAAQLSPGHRTIGAHLSHAAGGGGSLDRSCHGA